MSKNEAREQLMRRLFDLKKTLSVTRDQQLTQPLRSFVFSVVNLIYDMPLLIKIGVHYGLFIDAVEYIGTAKHVKVVEQALALNEFGCFALTELGHGSNVSAVETVATFNKENRTFTINSPTPTSAKWWIGGAAQTSNKTVLFAQMVVDGVNHGPQAFLIDLRDRNTLKVLDGIQIGDCGFKSGNNSIDNGFILFKNHQVPYDSLLDRFCRIDANGKFHTSIKKKEKRLGIMLSSLVRGRTCCVSSSQANLLNALTIAIRYSAVRRQFSAGPTIETRILDYPLTRTRLIPHLANLFGNLASNEIIFTNYKFIREKMAENHEAVEVTEFHAILSVLKSLTTDWAFEGVHECRRVCGGLGYSHFSRLGQLMADHDINLTWEGDNHVLLQQTAGFIIKQSLKATTGKNVEAKSLKILKMDLETVHKEKPSAEFSVDGLIACFEHLLNLFLHKSLNLLQKNASVSSEYFDVWNLSQPPLQKLAKIYGIVQIAHHWKLRNQQMRDKHQETFNLLEKLLTLFLIDKVRDYSADLLAEGFFDAGHLETLERNWKKLCVELGSQSVRIVDAITLSDQAVGSVLGCSDGQMYKRFTQAVEAQKDCYEKNIESVRLIQELLK
jgi:acyl-CoA oxidase